MELGPGKVFISRESQYIPGGVGPARDHLPPFSLRTGGWGVARRWSRTRACMTGPLIPDEGGSGLGWALQGSASSLLWRPCIRTGHTVSGVFASEEM